MKLAFVLLPLSVVAATKGVKTPGVQIPFTQLKSESETVLKSQPCGKPVTAFRSTWVADCATHTIQRKDAKEDKIEATLPGGDVIAGTADSIWTLADSKTTLLRIDPDTNKVVSELRLPSGCNTLLVADEFLWSTCPGENKVLRINPTTNLVDKTVDVPAKPRSLAFGEASLWVYCDADGKLVRVDPKTQKITQTIELNIPNGTGEVVFGEGSAWVSATGFPITRVDPASNAVVQQFYGDSHGTLEVTKGALLLTDSKRTLRFDPKRIAATLAE